MRCEHCILWEQKLEEGSRERNKDKQTVGLNLRSSEHQQLGKRNQETWILLSITQIQLKK